MSEMTPLSASRIKTLHTCSWLYYCKYKLHLPDPGNDGSSRGSVCHLIFEILGNPRHKHHYDKIIKTQNLGASPAVYKLTCKHADKLGVSDTENFELIKTMILEGLNCDFFGVADGKPTESHSELDFDITKDEDGKRYRIRGFIDKLFLFKKKRLALIRDFKTSKKVFDTSELEDNMQDYMYCLAVKHLYPEYLKRKMEFVFVKFNCSEDGEGLVRTEHIDDIDLEGFEYFLTDIQKTIDGFDEETAKSNFAYDKGYSEPGFAGRVVCGTAEFPGQLKKCGNPRWFCRMKFSFDYYHLVDKDGKFLDAAYEPEYLFDKMEKHEGSTIKKLRYFGCPAHSRLNSLNDMLVNP